MKQIIALSLLLLTQAAHALDLTVGVAACTRHSDYCDPPLGHAAIGHAFMENGPHQLRGDVDHYSRLTDGFGGTKGVTTVGVNYRYTLGR